MKRPLFVNMNPSPERVIGSNMITQMNNSVIALITGLTAGTAMPLFTGLTATPSLPASYTPNVNFWGAGIRAQFTCVHQGLGPTGTTSHGMVAITPRHVVDVSHYLVAEGTAIRYVDNSGTAFDTTILKRYTEVGKDLSIYLLADALPAGIHKIPVMEMNLEVESRIMSGVALAVGVSQGNVSSGTAFQTTPANRKGYCGTLLPTGQVSLQHAGLVGEFGHSVTSGDSGQPTFILLDDTLYLIGNNGFAFSTGVEAVINSYIAAVDASASISTGHTLTVVLNPLE